MEKLQQLEPHAVFRFFQQICGIPHGSGNTAALARWIIGFAEQHGLDCLQDPAGNVIVYKPAAPGWEHVPTVILQGHLDMVCEKTADSPVDFARDGLELVLKDGWITARGTTLGGDDGIAVAMMLAVLDSKSLRHPPLECVFTSDEEVGMLGAVALDGRMLQGRLLLNLDSEEEGVFTVSCAGGVTLESRLEFPVSEAAGFCHRLTVSGLLGGHSGTEIHKGRANANRLLVRTMSAIHRASPVSLVSLSGGQKDNAIPREATALFFTDVPLTDAHFAGIRQKLETAFAQKDPGLQLTLTRLNQDSAVAMNPADSGCLLQLLEGLPDGVQAMSQQIPGLPQTSLNLGILRLTQGVCSITHSVRSSVTAEKEALTRKLCTAIVSAGGRVQMRGEYPAWEYRSASPLRQLAERIWQEQTGRAPKIEAIHAGLECGIFAGKLPGLDAISFGPDMQDVHTTDERLSITSVGRIWDFLCAILEQLGANA